MNRRELLKLGCGLPLLGLFGFSNPTKRIAYIDADKVREDVAWIYTTNGDSLLDFVDGIFPPHIAHCDRMYLSSNLWVPFRMECRDRYSSYRPTDLDTMYGFSSSYKFRDLPVAVGSFRECANMVGFRRVNSDGETTFHCFRYPTGEYSVHVIPDYSKNEYRFM